jgi:uncharacterized protein involved in cysteine biosynthesis
MAWFFKALRLVVSERSLWGYIVGPLSVALAAYAAVLVAGYTFFAALLGWAAARWGVQPPFAWAAAGVVVLVLWVFVSGPVFIGLASVSSALVWDKLSLQAEGLVRADPPQIRLRFGQVAADLALRGTATVVLAMAVMLFGWFGLGLFALAVGGWMGLSDFTAPALARRGAVFPRQPLLALRLKGWPGFWLLAGLSSLVPFVNVVLLPVWIVAGTLMVAASDASRSAPIGRPAAVE